MPTSIEALLARLRANGGRWPNRWELPFLTLASRFAAHRWADREALAQYHPGWKPGRVYKADPLPELISGAFANLLFGEDPTLTPARSSDEGNLERIRLASDLGSELWRAQDTSSSEGEVWARIVSRPDLLEAPQILFSSRRDVVPLFVGPKLVAAAFVEDFVEEARAEDTRPRVRRLFEIHAAGAVANVLFDGQVDRLGEEVSLESFSESADLDELTTHDFGILCARIRNRVGPSPRIGRSDLAGIEDYLFDLNESIAIAAENARLTAKKRAVVSGQLVNPGDAGRIESVDVGDGSRQPVRTGPTVDLGEDLFVANALDSELGNDSGPFKVLEYQFDAEALIAHKRDLVSSAATRVGLTPQFLGIYDGSDGQAESGTALRVRLYPTTGAGRGRARAWDTGMPQLLLLAQLVDAAPVDRMGYGNSWAEAGTAPGFARANSLPDDETEIVSRHAAAVTAEIESRETAIRAMHPDWSDAQVTDELRKIEQDAKASARSMGLGAFAPAADDAEEPSVYDGPPPPAA